MQRLGGQGSVTQLCKIIFIDSDMPLYFDSILEITDTEVVFMNRNNYTEQRISLENVETIIRTTKERVYYSKKGEIK